MMGLETFDETIFLEIILYILTMKNQKKQTETTKKINL